jgi:NAD(P)-dependent dehydrogenase (short-subunit alcohol dehydrogenase family)
MRSFEDRVAVVTGAASGIGRALALDLAGRGAHLAISDIDEDGLAETRRGVEALGAKVTAERLDVADRDAFAAHAEQVVSDHGKANLIINNAGVTVGASVADLSHEDLQWLMGINYWGVVHGTQLFLPHLKASGDGHVVNISSVFGLISVPGQAAYHSAKFAVRGFTECLREELDVEDCGVSATCIHPGGIRTNIARNARMTGELPQGATRDELNEQFERAARTTPEGAAQKILRGVEKNKRRVLIGREAYVIDWVQRLFPTGYQKLLVWATKRGQAGPS